MINKAFPLYMMAMKWLLSKSILKTNLWLCPEPYKKFIMVAKMKFIYMYMYIFPIIIIIYIGITFFQLY